MRTQRIWTRSMSLCCFFSQIKTKQRYIWTKREFTEEGAVLGELVDQVSPLTLQTSGSPDLSGSEYLFVFMWLISPSERFLSVCCIFIGYLFFPSAPPISPQGSLKFHLSPCLCLVVINSRWTEHGDQHNIFVPYTQTKEEKSRRFTFSALNLWIVSTSSQPSCSSVFHKSFALWYWKLLRH